MAHGDVREYTIAIPDEVLADLKQRLAHTRLPGEVADSGWQYGTNLAYLVSRGFDRLLAHAL
ncbi:MAG TPA: epoxide hydrolase N-terminal domain-containing protein [Candidatus Binataceae bacterium]